MHIISTCFRELNPGDFFFSPRTGKKICIKLDGVYLQKHGPTSDALNAFVPGDELGNPTLMGVAQSERVEQIVTIAEVRQREEAEQFGAA